MSPSPAGAAAGGRQVPWTRGHMLLAYVPIRAAHAGAGASCTSAACPSSGSADRRSDMPGHCLRPCADVLLAPTAYARGDVQAQAVTSQLPPSRIDPLVLCDNLQVKRCLVHKGVAERPTKGFG